MSQNMIPLRLETLKDECDATLLRLARKGPRPVKVAVLVLVRDGRPDSPVQWAPEFGDLIGVDEMMDDRAAIAPFLRPDEKLEIREIEAKL